MDCPREARHGLYYAAVLDQLSSTKSIPRPRRVRRSATRWALAAVAVGLFLVLTSACSSGKKATSSSSGSLSSVDQILQDGVNAQSQGRLDIAREKYLQVIQQDPTNKIAFYDLGVIYQQLNDAKNARDAYQKAIAIDAKYSPALFNLAILETPLDPARAEQLYRQLLQINPKDPNVHFNLGLMLKNIGRTEEGDAEVQAAVQIDPAFASRIPASSSESSSSSSAAN